MINRYTALVSLVASLLGFGAMGFSRVFSGCSTSNPPPADSGVDAGERDAGEIDASELDAGTLAHVTIDSYPRTDGSSSTLPLDRVIACELLGLSWRWEPNRGSEGQAEIVAVETTSDQEALVTQVNERIVHSRTHEAYTKLIDGTADLIMVANEPSPEELAYANTKSVTLVAEAIGLDALVIVVNSTNTVRNLTTPQIRSIFKAEITNWSAVGGAAETINPYVRPVNSGSQQLFDVIVMQGEPSYPWPDARRPAYMGGLIDMIDSDPLAIGYSVYYWVTYQYVRTSYAVISVDGITPDATTIADRSYPYTSEVWMVTRAGLAPSSMAGQLHDFVLSPAGQALVAQSGYVPFTAP